MIRWLYHLIGIDYSQIKSNNNTIFFFSGIIILALSLVLFGFYYAIYNTTESVLLGVLLAIFFSLFVLNIYRLVFSISEGELNKYVKFWDVSKFILKRGFLIIALSLFISKSLEVYIFKDELRVHVKNYKNNIKAEFNKTIELGLLKERDNVEEEYNISLFDDKLFGTYSEQSEKVYAQKRENKLIELKQLVAEKNKLIENKIQESEFFITKIQLLNNHIPQSWLVTVVVISIFLSPFYIFLLTPLFTEYDSACYNISNRIIIDEYNYFKAKYPNLMEMSIGNRIELNEKFEDPPFNLVKIKSNIKVLKKGSLLKWFEMFD